MITQNPDQTMGLYVTHRRRKKTEEKAKVVACVLGGTTIIQFLATLAIMH